MKKKCQEYVLLYKPYYSKVDELEYTLELLRYLYQTQPQSLNDKVWGKEKKMWEEMDSKKVLRDRIREVIPFSHLNTQNHDRILQIGDKICSQEYVNGNWETKNCIDIQ